MNNFHWHRQMWVIASYIKVSFIATLRFSSEILCILNESFYKVNTGFIFLKCGVWTDILIFECYIWHFNSKLRPPAFIATAILLNICQRERQRIIFFHISSTFSTIPKRIVTTASMQISFFDWISDGIIIQTLALALQD